jgi:hypothetical protein
MNPLAKLVERRSFRGRWTNIVWLLVYLPIAAFAIEELKFHGGARFAQLWPFLIPIGLVALQLFRPTILVWGILVIPTGLYFCVGVYYAVRNAFDGIYRADREGLVLGMLFLALLFAAFAAVAFVGWPRSFRQDGDFQLRKTPAPG